LCVWREDEKVIQTMALFSTLLSSSTQQLKDGSDDGQQQQQQPQNVSSTSSSIPTVIQLYNSKALTMMPGENENTDGTLTDPTTTNPGTEEDKDGGDGSGSGNSSSYEVLSYQAIQVSATLANATTSSSSSSSAAEALLFGQKRKFITPFHKQLQSLEPNLGVWNCRCPSSMHLLNNTSSSSSGGDGPNSNNKNLLIDQLLKVPLKELEETQSTTSPSDGGEGDVVMPSNNQNKRKPAFMLTVDLSDPTEVEPNLSTLQQALVRHLIESSSTYMVDPTSSDTTSASTTATTSLEQLRQVQFGMASHDLGTIKETTTQESDAMVKIALVICAIVPPSSSIQDYKSKQAQSLLFYHLRKYAAALKATLCMVRTHKDSAFAGGDDPESPLAKKSGPNKKKKKYRNKNKNSNAVDDSAKEQEANASLTPMEMAYVLRQTVLGKELDDPAIKPKYDNGDDNDDNQDKEEDTSTTNNNTNNEDGTEGNNNDNEEEDDVGISAIYRPGPSMQEDLIETVLLRNAHCSGEWDAATDSIWLALPSFGDSTKSAQETLLDKMKQSRGDDEWLVQLRSSVSALMVSKEGEATNGGGSDTSSVSSSTSKTPKAPKVPSSTPQQIVDDIFKDTTLPPPSTKKPVVKKTTKKKEKASASKKKAAAAAAAGGADKPDVSSFFEDLLKK